MSNICNYFYRKFQKNTQIVINYYLLIEKMQLLPLPSPTYKL